MKVFIAALGAETNTFAPLPTGWTTFNETLFFRGDATAKSDNFFAVPLHVWKKAAEREGAMVVESVAAFAMPAGVTVQKVWEELRDMVLADLVAAGPVDMVLLHMHGAMVADACDDCEGDLLMRVRAMVGPDVVIGTELDLHCHLTQRIIDASTLVVLYKEYPHIDIGDRAADLFRLALDAARGRTKPVMALHDCRMLGVWRTPKQPTRGFVDRMLAAEGKDGILSLSFGHGFPWANVPDVGAKTLAITDGDPARARRVAEALAAELWEMREASQQQVLSVEEAVALACHPEPGVTVMADISDNAGGGAASDSTFLLAALHAVGAKDVAIGCFWDPLAVRLCQEVGVGARLPLRIGGKIGPMSGDPIDLLVHIKGIVKNASLGFAGGRVAMGDAVLVEADGIHIVLNDVRTQTFHPEAFTQFGGKLADFRTVVVKSMQHFYAAFEPDVDRILYVAAPGTVSPDFATMKVPRAGRPLWPQVADPFASPGLQKPPA